MKDHGSRVEGTAASKEERPTVTEKQFHALQRFVVRSKDLTDFGKRTLVWMLENTERLTRGIRVTFPKEHELIGKEAADGFHDINSYTGSTHIGLFLKGMGLGFPGFRIFSRRDTYYILYIAAGKDGTYDDVPLDLDAIALVGLKEVDAP